MVQYRTGSVPPPLITLNRPIRAIKTVRTIRMYVVTVSLLLLQITALAIFSLGFFPWRDPTSMRPSGAADAPPRSVVTPLPPNDAADEPVFERMVFMVVDALRQDFMLHDRYAAGFRWLRGALPQHRRAIAVARAPTVTLPRLKALTAGTAPQFLDLIANLASGGVAAEDSWVRQLHARNQSVLHYGDDTWLRLFPGMLHGASEGTHSFFVTDTVEVDRNVTRHLPGVLQRQDEWRVLTLHYLGLDHIGHVGGVSSPLLIPKLQEMDGVVRDIYAVLPSRSLLVVLGDHGMTDSGNHGGSSREERETACAFLSPLYRGHMGEHTGEHTAEHKGGDQESESGSENSQEQKQREQHHEKHHEQHHEKHHERHHERHQEMLVIDQVDVAVTVSLLLGLPVPRGSTGRLIEEFVPAQVGPAQLLRMWRRNAAQLAELLQTEGVLQAELEALLGEAGACHEKDAADAQCAPLYRDFCARAGATLGGRVGEYDVARLLTGIVASVLSVVLILAPPDDFVVPASTAILLAFSVVEHFRGQQGVSLAFVLFACGYIGSKIGWPLTGSGRFLLLVLGYGGAMFASTYIEEEHEYWHFFYQTLNTAVLLRSSGRSAQITALARMLLMRALKYWNATGFLHQGDPDIRAFLAEHRHAELALFGVCLCVLLGLQVRFGGGRGRGRGRGRDWLGRTLYLAGSGAALLYKTGVCHSIAFQRACLALCALAVLAALGRRTATLLAIALFYMLVLKAHNAVPVLVLVLLALGHLRAHSSLTLSVALLHASYFVLGPCHIIASVDFSPAYIGQEAYHPAVTAAMGLLVTWAGPILTGVTLRNARALLGWRGVVHAAVLSSLAVQRHHISVWTVFAPRLLFEYGWTIFYTLATVIVAHSEG